jgi:hypothetical protein
MMVARGSSSSSPFDLAPHLRGPIFEPLLADRDLFRSVRVDPECETIVWPNRADMDPDVLLRPRPSSRHENVARQRPLISRADVGHLLRGSLL